MSEQARPESRRLGYKMHSALLRLSARFQSLQNDERGQDLTEFALLMALIVVVCIASITQVATAVGNIYSNISTTIASVA